MSKIQFTSEDVANKYTKMIELEESRLSDAIGFTTHELRGTYNGILGFTDMLKVDENFNTTQKEYLEIIANAGRKIVESTSALAESTKELAKINTLKTSKVQAEKTLEEYMQYNPNKLEKLLQSIKLIGKPNITNFQKRQSQLIQSLNKYIAEKEPKLTSQIESEAMILTENTKKVTAKPLLEAIIEKGQVCSENTQYLELIDSLINKTIYKYNTQFSPNFKKDQYLIKEDIKGYCANQYQNTNNPLTVQVKIGSMVDLISKYDIFNEAIIPIIDNSEHAFANTEINRRNDKYNKLSDSNFKKIVTVSGEANPENKTITLSIADNGLGIPNEVKDILFTEGATIREEKKGHGEALYLIKKNILRNGGQIWFDTELGKGTTFYITLPYDRQEDNTYIKD
jgi:signal transduction histidine kinase